MQKDISYHQSAIQYNEELADFAEDLSKRLENEEVAKWAQSVSKQHRFHAGRHKKSLSNLEHGNGPGVGTSNEKLDVHPKFQRPKKQ